jgi:hypothetical protein
VTKQASVVSSGIVVHQDYRAVFLWNELSTSDGHHPRNHRFLRDGRGRSDGGLPFGAIVCFDLATETADRALSRAATPIQSAGGSEHGRAMRSTDESRSPPILLQHFHIFGEFVVSFAVTHLRTFWLSP